VNGHDTSAATDDDEARNSRSCRIDSSKEQSLRQASSMDNITADGYDDQHKPHGTGPPPDKSDNDKVQ